MKQILTLCMLLLVCAVAEAAEEKPVILVIGASYANGNTPYNDMSAPLGGISTEYGRYLSLGNALIRHASLPGFVVNEAQAGATTFDRQSCLHTMCTPQVYWEGYDKQFTKALARVTKMKFTAKTISVEQVYAKYVLISLSNDCLHADAFGMPWNNTKSCTQEDMQAHADRLVAVGQRILDAGLTPIFENPPAYSDMDLKGAGKLYHLPWMIDEDDYERLGSIRHAKIKAKLPAALQLNVWQGFKALGDGWHPNRKTVERAAQRFVDCIADLDACRNKMSAVVRK